MISTEEILKEAHRIGMTQEPTEIKKLVEFVSDLKPVNVLEIGSDRGGSFYLWTQLASGKKISVDLCGGPFAKPRSKEQYESIAENMKTWSDNVHVIRGNSQDQSTKQQVKDILGEELLDFLFIDGDHTFKGVESDYMNYKDLVRKDGWIAFHDINDTARHRSLGCHVAFFWEVLMGKKVEFVENKSWAGIGLLQKSRRG